MIVDSNYLPGIPVAWALTDSGTTETLGYLLKLVRERNPTIIPKHIMTDRDAALIAACTTWYSEALHFLCWWHVLHAWQQHFVISQHEVLWTKLKLWIRVTDPSMFNDIWIEIQAIAPSAFLAYLVEYWMPDKYKRCGQLSSARAGPSSRSVRPTCWSKRMFFRTCSSSSLMSSLGGIMYSRASSWKAAATAAWIIFFISSQRMSLRIMLTSNAVRSLVSRALTSKYRSAWIVGVSKGYPVLVYNAA